MADSTWRSTVPSDHLFGSLSGQPQDNVYRFVPDQGKQIMRKMSTTKCELLSFVVPMTAVQFDEFKDMFTTDFGDGSLNFTAKNPVDGTTKTFSFAEMYSWSQVTKDRYDVGMSLIQEPNE